MLPQHLSDGFDDSGLHQLARRDVDAHRERLVEVILPLPQRRLPTSLAEDPDAERNDDAGFFRKRNELGWRNHFAAAHVPSGGALRNLTGRRFSSAITGW